MKHAPPRRRLDRSEREARLLDLAAGLVVRRGHLPVPVDQLAGAAGVSKALIYSYFPTQHRLVEALLARSLPAAIAAQRDALAANGALEEFALAAAAAYFQHVADQGPLLHILLSDRFAVGGMQASSIQAAVPAVLAMARRLRRETGLGARDSVAAVHLLMALVEEAGTLVHRGQVRREVGLETCRVLVRGGLDGLLGAAATGGGDKRLPSSVGDRA